MDVENNVDLSLFITQPITQFPIIFLNSLIIFSITHYKCFKYLMLMGFLFIELESKVVEVNVLTNKEYEVFFPSVLHRTETQIFSKLIDKKFHLLSYMLLKRI